MTTDDLTPEPSDWIGELTETVDLVASALEHLVQEDDDLRARADSWNRQLGEARRELVRLQDQRRGDRQRTLRLRKLEQERNSLRERLAQLMDRLDSVAGGGGGEEISE